MYITKQYRFPTMWMNASSQLNIKQQKQKHLLHIFNDSNRTCLLSVRGRMNEAVWVYCAEFLSCVESWNELHQWNKAENHPRAILYTFYIILFDRLFYFACFLFPFFFLFVKLIEIFLWFDFVLFAFSRFFCYLSFPFTAHSFALFKIVVY